MTTISPTQLRVHAPDGTAIVCESYGRGPAAVVIHGTLQDARVWADVARRCTGFTRMIVMNRRGRPPSGPLGAGYDLEVETGDVHAILDMVGPGCALVGHSYGAVIAILTALQRPQLRALVLYEPPLPLAGPVAGRALPSIAAAIEAGDLDRALEIILTEVVCRPPESIAALRAVDDAWAQVRALAPPALTELGALDATTVDLGRLSDLTVPTTVLLGELSDPRTYAAPARALVGAIPRARLVVLAGQGHLAHMEAPGTVAQELERALAMAVRRSPDDCAGTTAAMPEPGDADRSR